jgi:hypothetical protein
MRKRFTKRFSCMFVAALAVCMSFAFKTGFAHQQTDTTNIHFFRSKTAKTNFKNGLHLVLPPIKPAIISTTRLTVAKNDDKLLNNVQVYPNPVTDQINLKYELSRNSNVTIKIMDVLGNDVITIFSQRVEPGEKVYTYSINNKLNRGFYFVRIVAGPESVIKRISVL